MFIGNSTNLSPTRFFDVAGGLSHAFTAVELTANGIQTAGASSIPVGIFNGSDVNIIGATYWQVGGQSIVAGDLLASDENGFAVKATSGKFAFGQALENASASSVAEVQIVRAGIL